MDITANEPVPYATCVFSAWKPVYLADGKWEEAGHGGEASGYASGAINWENTYFVM